MSVDLFLPVIERLKGRIADHEREILKGQMQPQIYNYTVGQRHGLIAALNVIEDILEEND